MFHNVKWVVWFIKDCDMIRNVLKEQGEARFAL